MANAFYNAAKHDILTGDDPWVSGSVKATLVNAGYTFNIAHTQYSDISGSILSGVTDQSVGGKTVSPSGTAAGNSVTFGGVTAAQTAKAVIIYIDLGGGVTRLIAYFDTGTGFPLTTTGANITIDWNNTPVNGTVYIAS